MKKTIIFFGILFLIALTGIGQVKSPKVYSSTDSTFEKKYEVISKGNMYEIQIVQGQKDVYFSLGKGNNGPIEFMVNPHSSGVGKLFLEDKKGEPTVFIKKDTIIKFIETFKVHFQLFQPYGDDIKIEFSQKNGTTDKFVYTIIVKRLKLANFKVKYNEQIYNNGGIINLGELQKDEEKNIDLRIEFDKKIATPCNILPNYKYGDINEYGEKIQIDFKETYAKTVKFNELGGKKGEFNFSYKCEEVDEEVFTVRFKCNVIENEKKFSNLSMQNRIALSVGSFLFTIALFFGLRRYISRIKKRYIINLLVKASNNDSKEEIKFDHEVSIALDSYQAQTTENFSKNLKFFNDEDLKKDKTKHHKITKTVRELRDIFLTDLMKSETPSYCDSNKIKQLKQEWISGKDGNSSTGKGQKKGKHNKIIDRLERDLKSERTEKENLHKNYKEKLLEKDTLLEKKDKELESIRINLKDAQPYPSFMKEYLDLTSDIYEFVLSHHAKLSGGSIFKPLLESILYVKGQAKAKNPIFNQARKDEYLFEILRVKKTDDLDQMDRQTFFNSVIKGRGFNVLNNIGKLYIYSITNKPPFELGNKMLQEGFDLETLDLLFGLLEDLLKTEFNTTIYIPELLVEKFETGLQYDENNFSYLSNHLPITEIDNKIIYDIDRIGFRSINDSNKIITKAVVSHKIS